MNYNFESNGLRYFLSTCLHARVNLLPGEIERSGFERLVDSGTDSWNFLYGSCFFTFLFLNFADKRDIKRLEENSKIVLTRLADYCYFPSILFTVR